MNYLLTRERDNLTDSSMHEKKYPLFRLRKVCYRAKLHSSGTEWRAIHWERIIYSTVYRST